MKFLIGEVQHPGTGKNRFCGPSAISIIHGCDTRQAAALLRKVSNSRAIMGIMSVFMVKALREIGYEVVHVPVRNVRKPTKDGQRPSWGPPSFNQWMINSRDERGSDVFLVAAANHFIVVQGSRRCCALTQQIVMINDKQPQKKAPVREVYRIRRIRPVNIVDLLPVKPLVSSSEMTLRRKVRTLASKYGMELEWFDSDPNDAPRMVYPPTELYLDETEDPYYDNHSTSDWEDALKRVQTYVDAMTDKGIIPG